MKKILVIVTVFVMMLALNGIALGRSTAAQATVTPSTTGTPSVTGTPNATGTLSATGTPGATTTAQPSVTKTGATVTARPAGGTASATLRDANGTTVGTATFTDEGDQGVRVAVRMNGNLKVTGAHGIHIHDVGACTPTFEAAGEHYNPIGRQHPSHAGDLPNIVMQADGTANYEVSSNLFTLAPGGLSIFDFNGSALVIHANPDDLQTNPAGNSGERIACGVIAGATGLTTSGNTSAGGGITRTATLTSTAGVTTTPGAPTTLPVTGGEGDGTAPIVLVALGGLLLVGAYLLQRRNSFVQ